MATNAIAMIDGEGLVDVLQEAGRKLDSAAGEEVVLDFSAVRRVGPSALRALENLADRGNARAVRIVLRGVHVDVYKVLKLVALAPRFTFLN